MREIIHKHEINHPLRHFFHVKMNSELNFLLNVREVQTNERLRRALIYVRFAVHCGRFVVTSAGARRCSADHIRAAGACSCSLYQLDFSRLSLERYCYLINQPVDKFPCTVNFRKLRAFSTQSTKVTTSSSIYVVSILLRFIPFDS